MSIFYNTGKSVKTIGMYPYHNHNKKRIKNGELAGFEITQNYRNMGECLLLYFKTPPFVRPVRPARYAEYEPLLKKWIGTKETDTGQI